MRAATRRIAATTTLAICALTLVGCGVGQNITEYGTDLKANFVAACHTDVHANGKTTSTTKISTPDNFCECVYDRLDKTYRFDFDKWKAYEAQVADTKKGSRVPDPPEEVTKAMNDCPLKSGPAAPTTTSK